MPATRLATIASFESALLWINGYTLELGATVRYRGLMSPTDNDDLREFLERRFSENDAQFRRMDATFERIDQRFERIDEKFDRIDQRFDRVDEHFGQIGRQFEEVARRFDSVDRRIDGVENQVTELRQEMLGHFDEVYRRLDRLEQEYFAITQGLRRIEAGLADEGARREILERDLAELKQHVAALQVRIEDLEQRLAR